MSFRNIVRSPHPRSALLFALALAACTDRDLPAPTQAIAPSIPSPAAITLTASPALAVVQSNVTITQGRGIALRAVNTDPISAKQAAVPVYWASSNPAVATVTSTGYVRAISAGLATITASASDRRFVANSAVTVAARPNCDKPSPLPPGLTGIISPIPPTFEDTPIVFRMSVGDPDACHRYTYRFLTVPIAGTLYQVADDGTPLLNAPIVDGMTTTNSEGWVAFYPRPGYFGMDSFRYNTIDQAGGVYAFLPVMPLQILPVNDAPVAIPSTHVGENNVAVTNVLLQATDIDNLNTDVCISDLPKNGDLYWSSAIPANRVAQGDCRPSKSLRYVSRTDGVFGCGVLPARSSYPHTDSFKWFASDGSAASDTATNTIRINYVNQPPTFRGPERVSTSEDTPVTFTATGIDPDGNPFVFQINALPKHGTLWTVQPGSSPSQITSVPALVLTDASGAATLQYVPDPDFNTLTQSEDFHFTLSDGDLLPTCDRTMRIDVSSVNDAPTIIAPDRIGAIVALGGIGQPTGLSIGVADDARTTDVLAVVLRAQGPAAARIDLTDATGFTVQRISALELRFQGTLADINTLLGRGVQWTPNASGAVYGELVISVDDRGNFGPGGPKVGTKTVAVDVGFETDGGLEGMRAATPATRRPPH